MKLPGDSGNSQDRYIKYLQHGGSVCSSEALWQLYGHVMVDGSPSVIRLHWHMKTITLCILGKGERDWHQHKRERIRS